MKFLEKCLFFIHNVDAGDIGVPLSNPRNLIEAIYECNHIWSGGRYCNIIISSLHDHICLYWKTCSNPAPIPGQKCSQERVENVLGRHSEKDHARRKDITVHSKASQIMMLSPGELLTRKTNFTLFYTLLIQNMCICTRHQFFSKRSILLSPWASWKLGAMLHCWNGRKKITKKMWLNIRVPGNFLQICWNN